MDFLNAYNRVAIRTTKKSTIIYTWVKLTACDIALYIGPGRYQMFMEALAETGRDADLEGYKDVFWDAADSKAGSGNNKGYKDSEGMDTPSPIYGVENIVDKWTLLHWASYNGSPKVQRLFLLKGADPEHLEAIMLEDSPTLLPMSHFHGR
ncbi:hypothetical protein DL98DRAFT_598040 [Cadophora sp. DSE1049]|nr:hypothetical protein DL98DRAFT_598040 [Cadophora sp. DSE1049]